MGMFAKEGPRMLKLLIVEDDDETAKTIGKFLIRYFSRTDTEVAIERYRDARVFLETYPRDADVVFMDIELPGMNGMDAVRELRKTDGNVTVIFVTNLAQYAVSGYEVNAFDFIVKPIKYYNFAMKLRRAFECLDNSCKRKIWVTTRQGKQMIDADKLKYVEVMQHTLVFHMKGETVSGTGTLKSVQTALAGLPFALCNRCYLVNLHFVTQIDGNTVCVGGEMLQISIPKKKEFYCALNKYLAAGGGTE